MVIKLQVFESVVSFAVIVFVIVILKKKEVLKEEWSGIFSSLITQIVIPVIIFSQLAFNQIDTRHLIVVLCMFIAGIVSAVIFQIVQRFYIILQVGFTKYNAIYGSFAALPLFLIWLQICWLIFIYGAEISYAIEKK